ncbi:MAG: hypothetical protein CR986_06735 [Ignavibacteriae bacterium]|nr:MAG: hypothetical protein CR986_06735 [Ignavibacteriota bacterium]
MKIIIPKLILIITLFLAESKVFAQTEKDSLNIPPIQETADSSFIMQKSPTGAMLRSAILPGWGQFYNESYWKIPIIWGLGAWFIYNWNDLNNNYKFYRDLYNQSLSETSTGISTYKLFRDEYRDERDLFAIYFGLTYFLNIIDAYVDAHLFDFDIRFNGYTHQPELRIKFNL